MIVRKPKLTEVQQKFHSPRTFSQTDKWPMSRSVSSGYHAVSSQHAEITAHACVFSMFFCILFCSNKRHEPKQLLLYWALPTSWKPGEGKGSCISKPRNRAPAPPICGYPLVYTHTVWSTATNYCTVIHPGSEKVCRDQLYRRGPMMSG